MSNDWKQDLNQFFDDQEAKAQEQKDTIQQQSVSVADFFDTKVIPAFEEIKNVLEARGREVSMNKGSESASITVKFQNRLEIEYGVEATIYSSSVSVHPVIRTSGNPKGHAYYWNGAKSQEFKDLTKETIVQDFLFYYKDAVKRQSSTR